MASGVVMDIIEAAAQFARDNYPANSIPHVREMLYYCDFLAAPTGADRETLIVATYLHDAAAHLCSWEEHDVKSAEMAADFLRKQKYPKVKARKVIAAIMAHRVRRSGPEAEELTIEERVLYDADKLARSMGMGIALALLDLGRKPHGGRASWADIASAVHAARINLEETYNNLYTPEARRFARQAFQNSRAYCESLLALCRLHPGFSNW